MKTTNHAEQLIERARKEMKKRGVTVHRMAHEASIGYEIAYYVFNPERRQYKRKGKPKFSYEVGMKIQDWISK